MSRCARLSGRVPAAPSARRAGEIGTMREVTVQIRFTTPCLGALRSEEGPVRFDRDGADEVVFSPAAWTRVLDYAADATGRSRRLAAEIRIAPRVYAKPKIFRRYYKAKEFTAHEAFLVGDVITVSALLPDGLQEKDFTDMLRVIGSYRGLSPYGWQRYGFGRFDVLGEAPGA